MSKLLTVIETLGLPNDTWVEGFTGICVHREAKQSSKTGKTFWKLAFADEPNGSTINSTMFTTPSFNEGQRVECTGKGMKFKDGSYGKEISIGDKTVVMIGQPPIFTSHMGSVIAKHFPPLKTPEELQRAFETESLHPVFGATCGMALNQTFELLTKGMDFTEIRTKLTEPTWWAAVHEVASDVIRVAQLLEKGHLAPSVKQRVSGYNQAVKSAPRPIPAPPVSHPDFEPAEVTPAGKASLEKDLPF